MKEIDLAVRDATLSLQVIHVSLTEGIKINDHFNFNCINHLMSNQPHSLVSVSAGCQKAREQFEICRKLYEKLANIVPKGQYYRYNDHWSYLTQRLAFLIALTIFLEVGILVQRDTVAEILGCKL